jgi:hypothetical protein
MKENTIKCKESKRHGKQERNTHHITINTIMFIVFIVIWEKREIKGRKYLE